MIAESWGANTNKSPNFFCTMSAHLLCAGVSGQQSWQYQDSSKPRAGGLKNLIDVYNFWSETKFPEVLNLSATRGQALKESKEIRNIFFSKSLKTVLSMLEELISYGMSDVNKVYQLYKSLFPAWLAAIPALESQYFYLKRAKVNYSTSDIFKQWFLSTEEKYQKIKTEINQLISDNNNSKLTEFKKQLDDSINSFDMACVPTELFLKNSLKLKSNWQFISKPYLLAQALHPETQAVIKAWQTKYNCGSWNININGMPKWSEKESSADSPHCQLLLDAKYYYDGDLPPALVMFDKSKKFVYYTKAGLQVKITSPKKSINTKDNCGSILAADFISLWETGALFTDSPAAKKVVALMSQASYWCSIRNRLAELYVMEPGSNP